MRDFGFGEYLTSLRKNLKLTQEQVANMLGISNKAVSKWESGVAKPSVDKLSSLSKILNVTIEELLDRQISKEIKKIYKIVITGGPCAGKSTALTTIQEHFEKKGYKVVFVPECATELILSGYNLTTMNSNYELEKAILTLQLAKEKVYCDSASMLCGEKILIVCDRGTMDCKAFVEEYEFDRMLKSLNISEHVLRDSYDGVFHLITAAKGAEEFYNLTNNKARTETIEDARIIDNKLISAWTGHSHLRIIDNSTDFDTKIKKLLTEISNLLGEPVPFEIERKFLIKFPDMGILEKFSNCRKLDIIQTYLNSKNEEIRIRQKGYLNNFTYTKTTKKNINNIKRIEFEERISEEEYLRLLMNADTSKRQIRKTRYCLIYNNQYFEIDIYPFWQDKAIMEIELSNENQEITLPDFIEVIKEVTYDEEYKNSNLAKIDNHIN